MSYNGYLLHIFVYGKQAALILQQHNRLGRNIVSGLLMFRQTDFACIGLFVRDWLYGKTYPQQFTYLIVHNALGHLAGPYRVNKRLTQIVAAGHLNIQTVHSRPHSGVCSAPIRYGEPLETPLLTQDLIEQMLILGTIVAVDLVICRHHHHCTALLHCRLERFEVELTHGTLIGYHIDNAAVGLLIIQREMFETYGSTGSLSTFGEFNRQSCGQHRIFREIFVSTAAYGQTLNVDCRTEDHILATQPALYAHAVSVTIRQLG
ncbi:MAG: hypothetical protein BWY95_01289 [Bacteroidetes bacterium ADurb.BinA104]|nr:MAG: hypothetical protein BWY95_01289 [Bacteroidetes bacterium ADurb.BinA104]